MQIIMIVKGNRVNEAGGGARERIHLLLFLGWAKVKAVQKQAEVTLNTHRAILLLAMFNSAEWPNGLAQHFCHIQKEIQ